MPALPALTGGFLMRRTAPTAGLPGIENMPGHAPPPLTDTGLDIRGSCPAAGRVPRAAKIVEIGAPCFPMKTPFEPLNLHPLAVRCA